MNYFCSIPKALQHIQQGKILIVVDHEGRENEGDFFLPAEMITPEKVNFMITHGKGLLCVAITKSQAERLHLPYMVTPQDNTEKTGVNFAISVNATHDITSGISAYDRAITIQRLASDTTKPSDFTRPGHVFPLIAKDGGVFTRDGHTEAAVDLARLAGFSPAGVLCEIIHSDGKMAKLPELQKLCKTFDLKMISITDLTEYRKKVSDVVKVSSSSLPTDFGLFTISIYKSLTDNMEHAVLRAGNTFKEPVLTRIHSQCLTGDTFFSLRCDCHEQLHKSMKMMQVAGKGMILYLNQEGRGIGIANKINAYALQEKGHDTVEANNALGLPIDARSYKIAADILKDFGITKIQLLTNNPDKEQQLSTYGIEIVKRIPLEITPNTYNKKYLITKKERLGHHLSHVKLHE